MAQSAHSHERRANPLEIIGAWLHIWVPPRDAYVPPIPWKKLGIGFAAVLAVTGIALAIMVPRIDHSKEQTAAEKAAFKRKAVAQNHARVRKLQVARHGEARALLPAAGAGAAEQTQARRKLLTALEQDMFTDSRARAARGEFKMVTAPPTCELAAGEKPGGDYGVFDCFMPTTRIPKGERNPAGALGYVFRAVVDFRAFTYAWCKAELIPGEKLVVEPDTIPKLPKDCQRPTT